MGSKDCYITDRDQLHALIQTWLTSADVIAPVDKQGVLVFAPVHRASSVQLDGGIVRNSPKEALLPSSETLFRYEDSGQPDVQVVQEQGSAKRAIIIGVHPCEARAFRLLDGVFLSGQYADPYYAERRKQAILVVIGCSQPDSSCFCSSVGGSPWSRDGSDVFLVPLGDRFVVEPVSKAGLELEGISELAPASNEDIAAARAQERIMQSTMQSFDLDGLERKLTASLENPLWQELELRCLGCGVCSFLCPVCHCFDMQDVCEGQSQGKRIRGWDTCMSRSFTLQASGHNPRQTLKQRLQQRFLHKFVFMKEALGQAGCVGCGRCIRSCPAGIDVREVIRAINGE